MNTDPSIRRRFHPRLLRQALAAATVTALAFAAPTAFAQAAPAANAAAAKDQAVLLEAFVSTGTRFNDRTVIQSPVPIDVITGAELKKGGVECDDAKATADGFDPKQINKMLE